MFRGATPVEGGQLIAPPERPLKLIEYLGDSITEGILVHKPTPEEKGNGKAGHDSVMGARHGHIKAHCWLVRNPEPSDLADWV